MIAYLDTSAFVKLVKEEPQTAPLRAELRRWPDRASSRLLRAEALRAARVAGGDAPARATAMIGDVALLPVADAVLEHAASIEPVALRTLDAIHLASALSLEDDLGALFSYDRRMLAAAELAGIVALAPG